MAASKLRTIPDFAIKVIDFSSTGLAKKTDNTFVVEHTSIVMNAQTQIFPIDFISPSYSLGITKIKQLIEDLTKIPGIESVKPNFRIPNDYHAVTFEIKLLELFDSEAEIIWDTAQKLVYEVCRDLRDITYEKWYFHTQLVSDED